MAARLRFVDRISASPTVRLDLNADPWAGPLEGSDFSPGEIRRSVSASMLGDGDHVAGTSYGNRTVTLVVDLITTSMDEHAQAITNLNRELDRDTNLLEYRPHGATRSVFFRTFKTPTFALGEFAGADLYSRLTIPIEAEPFALGLRRTALSAVDVNNDPAAATNPMRVDLPTIYGDVPTPALLVVEDAAGESMLLTYAIRARGTPANLTHVRQAEAMSLGTDASVAVVAGFSGGSGVRITFAANNDLTGARLVQTAFLGTASTDLRGDYRLLARVARNGGVGTEDYELQASLGGRGPVVAVTDLTGPQWVDLGLFSVPGVTSIPYEGYGGELPSVSPEFGLFARRTSGSAGADLDVDVVRALPADQECGDADFGAAIGTTGAGMLDGPQDATYVRTAAGAIDSGITVSRTSGVPDLVPGASNRLYFIRARSATSDQIGDDFNLTVYYWPRYLWVPGVAAGPDSIDDLAAWWRADSLSLADGAAVSSWTDSSGSGHTASQATGAKQPTLQTDELNGQPVVRFDGGDVLTTSLSPSTKPVTVLAIVKPTDFTDERTILMTSAATGWQYRLETGTGKAQWIRYNTTVLGTATTALTAGSWAVVAVTYSSTGGWAHYLGSLGANGSGTNNQTFTATSTLIGGAPGDVDFWLGDIAEIIVYSRELTTAELNTLGAYAADLYGLSWTTL